MRFFGSDSPSIPATWTRCGSWPRSIGGRGTSPRGAQPVWAYAYTDTDTDANAYSLAVFSRIALLRNSIVFFPCGYSARGKSRHFRDRHDGSSALHWLACRWALRVTTVRSNRCGFRRRIAAGQYRCVVHDAVDDRGARIIHFTSLSSFLGSISPEIIEALNIV